VQLLAFFSSLIKSLDEQSEQPKYPKQIIDCIIDTLMTAHMASFAPSRTTVFYTFCCLASNPKVEQKCLEEIGKVMNKYSDTLNPDNFAYCDAFVAETMHLYSANVAMGGTLKKTLNLGKTTIPVGINVLVSY
jgi:cytochrome P450